MFQASIHASPFVRSDMADLVGQIARSSKRPRYAFMLLSLIAEVADGRGSAGPYVSCPKGLVLLRDWLSDTLSQMAERDSKRQALTTRVETELWNARQLPDDEAAARQMIDEEVQLRARLAGKTNLSRAVSELVAANLLRRHYQGYRVNHHNRGAQRQAVYTLIGDARLLLGRNVMPPPPRSANAQGELALDVPRH